MRRRLTLEYWLDRDCYIGRLKEVPGVFSQGKSLGELEENIRDAYRAMMSDEDLTAPDGAAVKDVEVEV